jgi:hypothetical protein
MRKVPFIGVLRGAVSEWAGSNLRKRRKPAHMFKKIGGAEGYRTLGLMTASHALSQLSYSPTSPIIYYPNVLFASSL